MSLDTYVKRDTDLNMNLQSPSFQNEPLCKQEKRVGKVHLRRRKLFSVSDVCAALEGSCTLPPSDTGTQKSLPPSDTGTRKSLPPSNPRTKKSEGSVNVSNPHLASSNSENFLTTWRVNSPFNKWVLILNSANQNSKVLTHYRQLIFCQLIRCWWHKRTMHKALTF